MPPHRHTTFFNPISTSNQYRKSIIWPWGSITLTTWHPYLQTLALTSLTSGSRLVGIVRSKTQVMEFFFVSTSRQTDQKGRLW
jgi:hypothetical protein